MTDVSAGLSEKEVAERAADGRINGGSDIKTKSVKRIVFDNVFTFFNFLNIALAALVLIFGELKNALFMGVIICNTAIGIIQEIRAKRTIDRLTLVSAPKAHVIRSGEEREIPTAEIVADDIVVLRSGYQAAADCLVLDGECEMNESLVTGESDPVTKKAGDTVLSGSFAVSGECRAIAQSPGKESFADSITRGAKYIKKTRSKMMDAINTVLKGISLCIIPIMAILMYNGIYVTKQDADRAVVSTVAAVIGMIPEGLVLLSSVVLAVSAIRLSMNRTLVQDLFCIETLARVDVLCLDKTGTITEGGMAVEEVIPIADVSDNDIDEAMTALACALSDDNPTYRAVRERWNGESALAADSTVPFSSARKWSGAHFPEKGSYIMGACEFILPDTHIEIREKAREISAGGRRVILLAHSENDFGGKNVPPDTKPLAFIAISDRIRKGAPDTLRYFAEQNVEIKMISGDDPVTVSAVAKKAGVVGADNYADASVIEDIAKAADKYTVFGRVTPSQKSELIKALKAKGHTVGMTGDGVNDVLALKEADCSVAMQSGSEAARNVSNLVLLDSDFASMPLVVAEGRRSINNVERSAALFLSKTAYSLLLAVMFVIIRLPFLFEPIQMTLVNALCIGAPSFLLALEPNKDLIRGSFIRNVMVKALPNGIAITAAMAAVVICTQALGFSTAQMSTLATVTLAAMSFIMTARCCKPRRVWKAVMLAVLIGAFAVGSVFFSGFFCMTTFSVEMMICAVSVTLGGALIMALLSFAANAVTRKTEGK